MGERNILVVGMRGKLHGVDRATGALVWSNELTGGGYGEVFLAIADDLVIASAHRGKVFAVDYASGETRWMNETSSSGRATILIDGDQVVVIKAGTIDCFSLAGVPQWTQPLSGAGQDHAALGFPGNVAQADGMGEAR